MRKNKKDKIISSIFILFTVFILITGLTSCSNKSTAAIETYKVQKGNIRQTVTSSGSIDASDKKNYTLQSSGEVLEVLAKGAKFKKGDILIKVNDSKTPLLISQAEENLITAQNSIDIAKINYQNALDANHVAIQLAQSNAVQSEQATQSALTSLENANSAADASLNNARLSAENSNSVAGASLNSASISLENANSALENANSAADASLSSAQIALNIAQDSYNKVISEPTSAPSAINTAKDDLRTAKAAYNDAAIKAQNSKSSAQASYEQAKASADQAKASAQSQTDSAEGAYQQAKVSAQSQADSAEAAYQQSLNSQSSSYWNNLSSKETAIKQIALTRQNIAQADTQLELSKISLEIAKLDVGTNEIIAPFDGIVLTSDYNQGGTAANNQATSGSVISVISNTFIIKTDINETDINKIKIGQDVNITLDAFANQQFHGKVSDKSLISKNTANVVTFEVTIKPDDSVNSSLLYGLSANLTIIEKNAQNVLFVPTEAVYKQNGKQYVDIYTATEKINSKDISKYTKQVEVTTGISNYNYIEIKSGLKEGDVIIASSTGKLNQSSTSNTGLTGGQGRTNTSTTEGTGQQNTSTTGRRSQTNTSTTGGTDQQNNQTTESTNQKSNSSTGSTG